MSTRDFGKVGNLSKSSSMGILMPAHYCKVGSRTSKSRQWCLYFNEESTRRELMSNGLDDPLCRNMNVGFDMSCGDDNGDIEVIVADEKSESVKYERLRMKRDASDIPNRIGWFREMSLAGFVESQLSPFRVVVPCLSGSQRVGVPLGVNGWRDHAEMRAVGDDHSTVTREHEREQNQPHIGLLRNDNGMIRHQHVQENAENGAGQGIYEFRIGDGHDNEIGHEPTGCKRGPRRDDHSTVTRESKREQNQMPTRL